MLKKLLIFFLACALIPVNSAALMPPEEIAKRNLEAELILIGTVSKMGKVLLPLKGDDQIKPRGLFVLKTQHVIKGFGSVKPGDLIKIIYRLPPKTAIGLQVVIAGDPPVKVSEGDVVLVYINLTMHTGFHIPVKAGSSVVVISGKPQKSTSAGEKEAK